MTKVKPMEIKPELETFAKIKVLGVGGSGGSAINRMIKSKIRGVEFVAINTDAQALNSNNATKKVHIGRATTRGLGAGMDPELGAQAAEENEEDIKNAIDEADMVFITCGLGGGTGTGAAPIVADIAREAGALTIAVVTKPFSFEGAQRRNIADRGLDSLIDKVDTIITIPNDRLLQVIDKKTSLLDAFAIVDEVLHQGVQGISEIITIPGLVNVDFADVKAIMKDAGSALMGIGRSSGENRAVEAARSAIDSPLLELSIKGAKGVLFTIAGGSDLSMHEVNEAAEVITSSIDQNAKVIFGAIIDESLGEEIKITVIATGFSPHVRAEMENERMPVEEKKVYAPASAVHKVMEDKQSLAMKNLFSKRTKPVEINKVDLPPRSKEEEELDIPAFIRKKMGK
ncbi:MAG: cell division protein FtsZ [Candidatus Komeilibacteria bacterium]|nr:cell division protein FtsZ [Candidatus Komeilibacteria bacterium]